MATVEQLDGFSGRAFGRRVAQDGASPGFPQESPVNTVYATATTTAADLVDETTNRRGFVLQNLDDANPVHVRLADVGGGGATTDDLRLGPYEKLDMSCGVTWAGRISVISVGGDAKVVLVEFLDRYGT